MQVNLSYDVKCALETLGVLLAICFLTFLTTNLNSMYMRNSGLGVTFIFQYLVLALPIIFTLTGLSSYLLQFNSVLFLLCVVIVFINRNYKPGRGDTMHESKDNAGKKPFITNIRSTLFLLNAAAILAVDFSIYPLRHHKTVEYGISQMDTGIGVYVFASGIMAPEIRGHKNTIKKTLVDVAPLLVIGIARFVVTKGINYPVIVTEYGLHWNFFISLAVIRLISAIIMSAYQCNMLGCVFQGFCILGIHQILLTLHLEQYAFSSAPRDNFIDANREGIIASMGYTGLYFLSVSVGFLLHSKNKYKLHIKLIIAAVLIAAITSVLHWNFNMSRRVANSTHCMWALFNGVIMTLFYYTAQEIHIYLHANLKTSVPFLFEAINYNGLAFYMIANVLTGCVNIIFNTQKMNGINSILVISMYLLMTCLIISFLYIKKIKLKI